MEDINSTDSIIADASADGNPIKETETENIKSDDNSSVSSEQTALPIDLPEPTSGYKNDIGIFCISQQGESHIKNSIPCQDRSEFRWVDERILIAAVADGVGSCEKSEYGAAAAVKASLDFLKQHLQTEMALENFVFDTPGQMKTGLSGAMEYACNAVEKRAESLNVPSILLQSTLTIAAYDGCTLYFAHSGDGGIVALNKEGTYAMVTPRIKGDEASSVFPLQSRQWFYGKVNDTAAFIMATDGVLDAFVRPESENNRVYYPFIEPVFYTPQTDGESAGSNCDDWDEYLKSSEYRNVVSDDITFVGVVNQKMIQQSVRPVFDDNEWKKKSVEYEKKRTAALYSPQRQDKADKKNIKNADSDAGKNFENNREMIVSGARRTLSGMADITVGVAASIIEAGGQILSVAGEFSEQAAEKIKQDYMQKNQQKTDTNNKKHL